MDLYVSCDVSIPVDSAIDVQHNVCCELPPLVWGLIIGRSSTARSRGLLVVPAVIDTGYRGSLFAVCVNISQEKVFLKKGERVAQFILMPNLTAQYQPVQAAAIEEATSRGARGFGSTGA